MTQGATLTIQDDAKVVLDREVPEATIAFDTTELDMEDPEDRAKWLAARLDGIGGSDASAIVGVNPYKSAYALFAERVGSPIEWEESEAAEWGKDLEPNVCRKWSRVHHIPILDPRAIYKSKEWPFMLATPDRLTFETDEKADGILEAKTAGFPLKDAWDNGPPVQYLMQCYHYMAVTGFERAHVGCLIGGQQFVAHTVERNDKLIGRLVKAESEFYERLLEGEAPEIDGSDSTTQAVKALFADAKPGVTIELGDYILTLLAEREEWLAYESEVEEGRDRVENEIRSLLGTAEIGRYNGRTVVTWKSSPSNRVNVKKVKAEFPDVAKACTDSSTTRRLLVPKGGTE